MNINILQGDCLDVLKTLDAGSVQTCVTSPPYYGLRDYGVDGQIGLEDTPEAFVEKLVRVFAEVRRVLADEGTLWLNLGDSYAGSGGAGEWSTRKAGKQEYLQPRGDNPNRFSKNFGLKPKDLIGIPWMVAFALRADGWYLRSEIIWHKRNPMPESVTDRPTKAHEQIFLLAKSPRYFYDAEAIKEPAKVDYSNDGLSGGWAKPRVPNDNRTRKRYTEKQSGSGQGIVGHSGNYKANGELIGNGMANKRSVWEVATQPYPDAHFATFPPKLIEPCILAGSRKGDTVLDPFNGVGTTGLVAVKHHRNYIGIELNPEYINLTNKRLSAVPLVLFDTLGKGTQ